jgi:Tol biopolymer transport system component/DNA-binding winged helix-turn-helix (wHTH) protein
MEHKSFVFRFEDVEVREREFLLIKAGETVPVEPRAFHVLLFLLRNPGRLVTKSEILDAVWKGSSVSDNSLTRSIALLRKLLGDDTREPRYIATVHTVGYRFLSDVKVGADGGLETATPHDRSSAEREEPPSRDESTNPLSGAKGWGLPFRLAGLGAALLAILLVGFLVHRRVISNAQPGAGAVSSAMHFVPLTSLPGAALGPAFSPDGKQFAFFWNAETPAKWNLYMQLVGGENPIQLTHTASGYICCADWSPDGREIAFARCDDTGGGIFVVPALGGPERKLTDVVCGTNPGWLALADGSPKWTADGKSLVLADRCRPDLPRSILVFSLATGEKRCLHAPLPGNDWEFDPVLSPDQQTVAFLKGPSIYSLDIYTVPLEGGQARKLSRNGHGIRIWDLMWSADGDRLVFESNQSGAPRVWQLPATGGSIEPETAYPKTGSLSRDGHRLAFVDSPPSRTSIVWQAELSHPGGPVVSQTRLLASAGLNDGAQLSPDGRQIVFQSDRSGHFALWKSDANGANPVQLTSADSAQPGTPRWSPDGKRITFDDYDGKEAHIYVIDAEGRNLHRITSGDSKQVVPSWSRDGTAIYFASNITGDFQIWRHELSTGKEIQITRHGGFAAFEGYDAKTLYFTKFEGGGVWGVPVSGGQEHHLTDAPHRGYWGHFAVINSGLYLVDSSTEPGPTIFYYDLRSHRLTRALMLKQNAEPWTANLTSSSDGRTLVYAQSDSSSSITMAETSGKF